MVLSGVTNEVRDAENIDGFASAQTFSAFLRHCRIQMDRPEYYNDCIETVNHKHVVNPNWVCTDRKATAN